MNFFNIFLFISCFFVQNMVLGQNIQLTTIDFLSDELWYGDTSLFVFEKGQSVVSNGRDSTELIFLSKPINIKKADELIWDIGVDINFPPSTSNYVHFILISDTIDFNAQKNGYYLKIGEVGSSDGLVLYQNKNGRSIKLHKWAVGLFSQSINQVSFRIERTFWGRWSCCLIKKDQDVELLGTYYEEKLTPDDWFGDDLYSGIVFRHTKTRKDKLEINQFELETFVDNEPPKILSTVFKDTARLEIIFDEPINREDYSLDLNQGNTSIPYQSYELTKRGCLLKFDSKINHLDTVRLVFSIIDLKGNKVNGINSLIYEDIFPPVVINVTFANHWQFSLSFNEVFSPLSRFKMNIKDFDLDVYSISKTKKDILVHSPFAFKENKIYDLVISGIKDNFGNIQTNRAFEIVYDTRAPKLDEERIRILSPNNIQFFFNENIKQIPSKFRLSINGIIQQVKLKDNNLSTVLDLETDFLFEHDSLYELIVFGVSDLAGNHISEKGIEEIFKVDLKGPDVKYIFNLSDTALVIDLDETPVSSNDLKVFIEDQECEFDFLAPLNRFLIQLKDISIPEKRILSISLQGIKDIKGNIRKDKPIDFNLNKPEVISVYADSVNSLVVQLSHQLKSNEIFVPYLVSSEDTVFVEQLLEGINSKCFKFLLANNLKDQVVYKVYFESILLNYPFDVTLQKPFQDVSAVSLFQLLGAELNSLLDVEKLQNDFFVLENKNSPSNFFLIEDKEVVFVFEDTIPENTLYKFIVEPIPCIDFSYTTKCTYSLYRDSAPPFITKCVQLSDNDLYVAFNEVILKNKVIENTFLLEFDSNSRISPHIIDFVSDTSLILYFEHELPNSFDANMVLSVFDLEDLSGNKNESLLSKPVEMPHFIYQDIVLTEMMVDPTPVIGLPNSEYIEIFNNKESDVELLGLRLLDSKDTLYLPDVTLRAKEYLLLIPSVEHFKAFDFHNILLIDDLPNLNNGEDNLYILNSKGELVDSVSWSSDWNDIGSGGRSLERLVSSKCDFSSIWEVNDNDIGGTPGTESLTKRLPIDIDVIPFENKYIKLVLNSDMFSGDEIIFFDSKIELLSTVFYTNEVLVETTGFEQGDSFTVFISDKNSCGEMDTVSISFEVEPNIVVDAFTVTEILFNTSSNSAEFIEFYYAGDLPIFIKNWDFIHKKEEAVSIIYSLNLEKVIEPNTFFVLTSNGERIIRNYSNVTSENVIEVDLPSLSNERGAFWINDQYGNELVDVVYSDEVHLPSLLDRKGISLEKMSLNASSNQLSSWTSSRSNEGGTPTLENSVFESRGVRHLANNDCMVTQTDIIFPLGNSAEHRAFTIAFPCVEINEMFSIEIRDINGVLINVLLEKVIWSKDHLLVWDGRDRQGNVVKTGHYLLIGTKTSEKGEESFVKKVVVRNLN